MANSRMYLGESTEHLVVSKLLDEGREVYLPVVDDHGIDILVKSKEGAPDDYQEIQVKAEDKIKHRGLFAALNCPTPRRNYWFVFYVKSLDKLWVINSVALVKIASQNQSGKNVGKYSINVVTNKKAPAPVGNFNMIP